MQKFLNTINEVQNELKRQFVPPRTFLQSIITNGVISLLFFLFSYYLGNYNSKLLPVAAASILLWTLADASLTNQLIFDKDKTVDHFAKNNTLKHYLLVKNLATVVLLVPLAFVFGLIMVAIVGKWTELLYGLVVSYTLIWGWLGISNALSVLLPFELHDIKSFLGNRHIWLSYSILYGLPWVLLPIYVFAMSLPYILLGWTDVHTVHGHPGFALIFLFVSSILIWLLGLSVAERYVKRPKSRLKKLV